VGISVGVAGTPGYRLQAIVANPNMLATIIIAACRCISDPYLYPYTSLRVAVSLLILRATGTAKSTGSRWFAIDKPHEA
jgi:hypothetical protein